MSRGDQRERDRAKKLAKEAEKGTKKEGNPLQRNESDAAALEAKRAAKAAAAAANAGSNHLIGNKEPVKPKKIVKKSDNFDDLLASGLDAGKKKRAK
ncbi:hypothetical protein MPSEU_000587000 [Mayamaea pseudoterrestris]|nr:hypothetical protein MPSEU_000587000 [Mayamaea pseudoterrestris]